MRVVRAARSTLTLPSPAQRERGLYERGAAMAAKIIPVPTFDCVVFGATGDLTLRKLLPALYYRFRDGQMPADSRIIGAARSDLGDDEGFRERAAKALNDHVAAADLDADAVERFCSCLHYVRIDATKPDADWERAAAVARCRAACGCSISPPRPISTARSAAISAAPAW